jgi:hypothetical protein
VNKDDVSIEFKLLDILPTRFQEQGYVLRGELITFAMKGVMDPLGYLEEFLVALYYDPASIYAKLI